jgi:hypothetical protein
MTTITFPDALTQVLEVAQHKLPASLQDRLGRAAVLVELGHVWLEDDGTHAMVQSKDGQRWHHVNAACDCALRKQHDIK